MGDTTQERKELTMNRPGERLIGKLGHAQATANGTTRLGHGATREGAPIKADSCPDVMKSGVNDGTAPNEVVTAGETAQNFN